jgi:hypothetical protein
MDPELLVESWLLRPFPGVSDSHLKWSPIGAKIKRGSIVYIVGIGSGGVLRCIPKDCKVFGVDLPRALSPLGQSYVGYRPPVEHPGYSTRPLSWLHDLSRLDNMAVSLLKEDVIECGANVVIIDIDRVGPNERIFLRSELAGLGPKCWVRVHSTPESIKELVRAVDSVMQAGDDYWEPEISVGCELIFGAGPRPLGHWISTPVIPSVPRILPSVNLRPSWDEMVQFVFRFGGTTSDVATIGEFIYVGRSRQGEGSMTPMEIYHGCHRDPATTLRQCGRNLCRMTLCMVSWVL